MDLQSSPPTSQPRYRPVLNDALWFSILRFLDADDLGYLSRVSRRFQPLTASDDLWEPLFRDRFGVGEVGRSNFKTLYRTHFEEKREAKSQERRNRLIRFEGGAYTPVLSGPSPSPTVAGSSRKGQFRATTWESGRAERINSGLAGENADGNQIHQKSQPWHTGNWPGFQQGRELPYWHDPYASVRYGV